MKIQLRTDIFPGSEPAYIIGGSVRDLLLGREPVDYDIAVSGNPDKFARLLAAKTRGRIVEIGKPGRMIIRIVSGKTIFDVTSLLGGSLEADLGNRDFTINAMACPLGSGEIIDPLGGLRDLTDKKIRMVSATVFKNDPVRLIRAYRMSANLDFEIDPLTVRAIRDDAQRIQHTAGERIRSELFKMMACGKSYDTLRQMDSARLLTAIFPELGNAKGCYQNRHHQYDVFEHTMRAYYNIEAMLNDPDAAPVDLSGRLMPPADIKSAVLLKCAILLHDIGKPEKRTVTGDGNVRFYGHSRKSADMALEISNRLRFSAREKRFVDVIIRNHTRPLLLFLAYKNNALTSRGKTRFFMKCGEHTPFLLLHTLADSMAKKDPAGKANEAFLLFVKDLFRVYFSEFKPRSGQPPLLTGHDLIETLDMTPSPLFGKILTRVKVASLSNKIQSKAEALQLAREIFNSNP